MIDIIDQNELYRYHRIREKRASWHSCERTVIGAENTSLSSPHAALLSAGPCPSNLFHVTGHVPIGFETEDQNRPTRNGHSAVPTVSMGFRILQQPLPRSITKLITPASVSRFTATNPCVRRPELTASAETAFRGSGPSYGPRRPHRCRRDPPPRVSRARAVRPVDPSRAESPVLPAQLLVVLPGLPPEHHCVSGHFQTSISETGVLRVLSRSAAMSGSERR